MKKYFTVLMFLTALGASAQVVKESVSESGEKVVDADLTRFKTADGQDIARFIGTNFNYPAMAMANEISGTIVVEFIVETDGGVKDVKIVQGVCADCDAEAVRVVKKLVFKPLEIEGKPERVRFRVPIRMLLQE